VIDRGLAEAVFADAVRACDPAARVAAALDERDISARLGGRQLFGIAIGKAALAMARGAGPVEQGVAIAPIDDGAALPAGWRCIVSAHPVPDERSRAAAAAAYAVAQLATPRDALLALISGGASALVEAPRGALSLAELRAITSAVMAAGAPISELNVVRTALSQIKGGGLALECRAPVTTLAVSDIAGDHLAVIGSGPTIGPWLGAPDGAEVGEADRALRTRAAELLAGYQIATPPHVAEVLAAPARSLRVHRDDLARVIAPMSAFAVAAHDALAARGLHGMFADAPVTLSVDAVARELAAGLGLIVAWGEPTLALPPIPGEGGRAQQLALDLARHLRGSHRSALVIGSDGADGPQPRARPTPAGAFVDGRTWDAIGHAGIDPHIALARCDAGTALSAVGALVVTGPTGVNHADLILIG
jgi:hydroxypyruvate reductase